MILDNISGQNCSAVTRTFAYARVSTIEQDPENQIREIAAAGFAVEAHRMIAETVSGSQAIAQRKGFARLLDKMERGDVLVVTKLDRLGRDAIDVSTTVAKLETLGIRVEKTLDGIWISNNPSLPVDEIMSSLEDINLKLLQRLFSDPSGFWDALATFDFDLLQAGLDPEARAGRDQFNDFFKSASGDAQKLIFYYSVRGYNHAAQNMLKHVIISLGDAYELLSNENLEEKVPLAVQSHGGEHYRNLTSPTCHRIWERLSYCIEKVISFLDFLSKYIAELSAMDGKKVTGRLNTSSVTFGGWRKIKLAKDTALTNQTDDLRMLMVLRDETVHNGTLDHFSRIYEHAVDSTVQARFLLIPDHDAGRILTAAGRRRFFHQDNHLNAILPTAIHRVLDDTRLSLRTIDERMPTIWTDPSAYFDRHKEVHEALNAAGEIGAFVKFSAKSS